MNGEDGASVGPAGIEPTTSTVEQRQFEDDEPQQDAEIIPLFGKAS